ncbi:hypothetical protein VNI00_008398 [Paramarasmius palmivorus]|uniref:Uncharacterized protein n=1 Tax=Paramarasmius palmivorus TaxID=297713 RepID=A0AAW0CXD3_9AGAR
MFAVDAVLLQQGHEALVAKGRLVKGEQSSGIKTLGKSITKPLNRFSKEGIVRYLISIPLNSIPVVGTVIFLLFNGRPEVNHSTKTNHTDAWLGNTGKKSGPSYHARYFQLKGLSGQTRKAFVDRRKGSYTAWVFFTFLLKHEANLVPVVGMAFNITSTVGAALWASSMERRNAPAGTSEEVDVKME